MLVESGLCLALQEDALPFKKGGFTSPAAGLGSVLMERLVRTGTYFESQAAKAAPGAAKSAHSKL